MKQELKYILLLFFLFSSEVGATQIIPVLKMLLPDCYPENTLYKKLKVRKVTEKYHNSSADYHDYIKEYDVYGRESAWYYSDSKRKTHYTYTTSGDTLVVSHSVSHNDIAGDPYEFHKFLYGEKGEILLHIYCRKEYSCFRSDDCSYCSITKFLYDDLGDLMQQNEYIAKVPKAFSPDIIISDSLFKLRYSYNYQFYYPKKMVVRKEVLGIPERRRIDTIIYDRAFHVVKEQSFLPEGYSGEFYLYNIFSIKETVYKGDTITIDHIAQNKNVISSENDRKINSTDRIILLPNGLPKFRYYMLNTGNWSLYNEYIYEFY